MKDFKAFKTEREKIDPSTAKHTDYQWKKAYEAYQSSRQRLRGNPSRDTAPSTEAPKRRAKRQDAVEEPVYRSDLKGVRDELVGQSAYPSVRYGLSILTSVGLLAIVASAIIDILSLGSAVGLLVSELTSAVVWIIILVTLRILGVLLIDIADAHLARLMGSDRSKRSDLSNTSD